jgi:hypothetical protein
MMAAGGLQGVTFDLDAFDEQSAYCPAPHPQEVLDELNGFVRDLARFSFVWLAFEGTMKQLKSRSQLQRGGGEAQSAVAMLRESEASGRPSPVHASCSAINLARVLTRAESRIFEKAAAELRIDPAPALSDAVAASRHFRNGFAHGGLFFPDPYSQATAIVDRSICVLTTRVTLLAMQGLIGNFFEERSATIETFDDGERLEQSVGRLVTEAHLALGDR